MSAAAHNLSPVDHNEIGQTIFQHGLISPPPLDDMFAADSSMQRDDSVIFQDGAETQRAGAEFTAVNSSSSRRSRTFAKNQPPTPSSLSLPLDGNEDQFERTSAMLNTSISSPERAERPRTIASERQSTSKKQRRDSDERMESKDKSREKNKIAAAKCRAKKRDNMEHIESSHRTLSAENSFLRRQAQELRATVSELRTMALDHQNCSCGVHQFNLFEARKIAQGLTGGNNMPIPARAHSDAAMAANRMRKDSASDFDVASPMVFHHNGDSAFSNSSSNLGMSSAMDEEIFSMANPVFGAEQAFFDFDPALAPGPPADA